MLMFDMLHPVQTYVLRRLAKGVGSGRAASRQGYATALASLLAAAKASQAGTAGEIRSV